MFISCARRVLWGTTDCIVIPRKELPAWRLQFGKFAARPVANGVVIRVSELSACAWGELRCQELVQSANPFTVGPPQPTEHDGQDKYWGLFAGPSLVYKSMQQQGRVRTVLSWYGHGGYDPESPSISRRERARVHYDPEYPDIELM